MDERFEEEDTGNQDPVIQSAAICKTVEIVRCHWLYPATWSLVTILDAGLVFRRIPGPRRAGPDERKHYMCRSGPPGLVPPTQQEYFLVSLNTTTVFGLA
jgi:hypothetical protein